MPPQSVSHVAASLAAVALSLATLACGRSADERMAAPRPAPLVEAVVARSGALPIAERLPGVVRARNQVLIRPETSGRVVEVLSRSGDAVRRGDALVRLDDREARERLRAAQADVRLAEAAATAARARATEVETRVTRTRALAQENLVSEQELETLVAQLAAQRAGADEAVARVEQARATLEEHRSALDKSVVRAPVGGRLGERRVEVGMQVATSTVLFEVGDLDELIVEVDLTENMMARVDTGQPVRIARRAGGEPVEALLSRISPFLAADSFTTRGEIDVDNRGGAMRPGMFVDVEILVGESQEATLVPISAVWEDPRSGERGVFVITDASGLEEPSGDLGTAASAGGEGSGSTRPVSFRRVEVLAQGRGMAGVSAIEAGEWVVTVGQHLLAAELEDGTAGTEAAATTPARVRPIAWQRIEALQNLQNEDLLEGFLDKQRKIAAALGADIPSSEDEVDRVLAESAAAALSREGGN